MSLNVNSIVRHGRKYLLNDFITRNPSHFYFIQETKFGTKHGFSFSSSSTFSSPNRPGCGGVLLLVHAGYRTRNFRAISGLIDGVFVDVSLGASLWISDIII